MNIPKRVSQNLAGEITTEDIKLNTGGITGSRGIKEALKKTKDAWTTSIVAEILNHWSPKLNFPYRTGALWRSFSNTLKASPPGEVHIGAPGIDYGVFVDAMEPKVDWTGDGNRYHWFQRIMKFFEGIKMKFLRKALKGAQVDILSSRSTLDLAEEILE